MVKCWYLRGTGSGQNLVKPRESNQTSENETDIKKISWSSLSKFGIKYWNLEVSNYQKFNTYSLIKQRQNLDYEYEITLNPLHPIMEKKYAEFDFAEHMHEIDEARFILNGEIYYDIYENAQTIIRIHLVPGDLLVIPKYRFHRTILPIGHEKVTFLQLSSTKLHGKDQQKNDQENEIEEKKKDETNETNDGNNDESSKSYLNIETYFMEDVQKNTKHFVQLMMQSLKSKNDYNLSKSDLNHQSSVNGTGYVMGGRAKALASYPHLREFNGMLFVSGTSSRRPNNTHIGAVLNDKSKEWKLDIKQQTRAVFENIKIILNTVGAGLEHAIALTVFLVDFEDYKGMNEVYNEYFDGDTGPTRTTVAVARLPHPNLLIEIQCTAAKPTSKL